MSLLNISKHVENIANVICLKATCSTRLQSKIRLYADDFIVIEQFFPHQLTQTASPSGADDITVLLHFFLLELRRSMKELDLRSGLVGFMKISTLLPQLRVLVLWINIIEKH